MSSKLYYLSIFAQSFDSNSQKFAIFLDDSARGAVNVRLLTPFFYPSSSSYKNTLPFSLSHSGETGPLLPLSHLYTFFSTSTSSYSGMWITHCLVCTDPHSCCSIILILWDMNHPLSSLYRYVLILVTVSSSYSGMWIILCLVCSDMFSFLLQYHPHTLGCESSCV